MKKRKSTKKESSDSSVTAFLNGGMVSIGNIQHQGSRPYQEDSFGFSDFSDGIAKQKGILVVLADGMGGLENGKAVSETAVTSLLEWFNGEYSACRSGADLRNITDEVNQRICDIYCKNGSITSGSTLVTVLIQDGALHWLSIGDSRLYLKRNGKLFQVSEDHDFLNQMLGDVIEGLCTPEKAYTNRQKDSLVGCIGKRDLVTYDFSKRGFLLHEGDILLVCSDGVYNSMSMAELNADITNDAMGSCERIGKHIACKNVAGQDNYTAVVLSYQEKGVL